MPRNATIGYIIHEDMYQAADSHIVEEANDRVIAEACLQEAEEENRNGRCYLTEDLTREMNCARTQELLKAGYMRGEGGHPTDTSIIRQQTIDPTNVAVQYLKFWMDGPKWMAHYHGTYNDIGEAVDKDLRHGCKPAFSMRALGTLENINGRNVVRDLRYITHDFVIYPSHPGAYTTKLVTESATLSTGSEFGKLMREKEKKGIITRESANILVTNDNVISYLKEESANVQSILEQFEVFYETMNYDPKRNRVVLTTKTGDTYIVNCESYIKSEIENYCDSIY